MEADQEVQYTCLAIQRYGEPRSKSKRYDHTSQSNNRRELCIALDDRPVNFKPNEEEKETEADIGYQAQVWARINGKDVLCEVRDLSEGSGAQKNPSKHFSDNLNDENKELL